MKHKRFEENILIDEAYTNYGKVDKNADEKKSQGIAKHFAETLEFEDKKKWYHQLPEEPSSTKTLTPDQVEEYRKEASSALHGDTLAYETKSNRTGSSDHQWAKTLLNKGAIGDRVAAATILIQDNPLYNLTALRNLISNVKPAKKKDGIIIIDAVSELLISDLLIPDVKLRTLPQHSLSELDAMTSGNKQARRNILKLWYFEDQLKELYGTYVEALNKFAHDSVEANKEKAVTSMSYLLIHHPEREKMLLTNIINKLGDPSQSVASKVIYHLCQLLYNHPNMKSVVLTDIEKMLFRANISPRAQYYGICFLNQFYLGKDDSKIAENLIRIYFSFFKAAIKKGEIDSRLMSAILTGVKRAYPFADKERLTDTTAHVDAIYKLVHLTSLNVSIHALALLFQISDANKGSSDRYYTALYRKLTNSAIFSTTHSALLFSLIYKSLKQDGDIPRVCAFIKRLLQLCGYMPPAQASGVLLLVSQVLRDSKKKDAVKLVWTKKEVKEEEIKEEPTEIKSDKEDSDSEETEENGQKEDVKEEVKEEKKVNLLKGDKRDLLEDDDEEAYIDLKIDDEGNIKPKKRRVNTNTGWFHAKVIDQTQDSNTQAQDSKDKELETKILIKRTQHEDKVISEYNPWARDPRWAGAACAAYVELLPLRRHYHPTVTMFADKLAHDQIIHYAGDPLKDFACIRFLDRFVFKNPKKRSDNEPEEGTLKKVKGSHPKFAARKNYSAKGIKGMPVNSSSYLNEDVKKIPVDEKFLYDFLQKRRSANESGDEDSDADSVTSQDFDQYLDTVTGNKDQVVSDEELDFLSEMEAAKRTNKKKQKDKGADDDDDAMDDDEDDGDDGEETGGGGGSDDDSDGELNISGDEDEPAFSGEEEELFLEGSDDDDDEIDVPGKKKGTGLKLKGKDNLGSLFASAEEFSTLLEETASTKKQGSSQAVSNTDNSSTKQLAWEDKRDHWIKGYNRKIHGHKGGNRKFAGNKDKFGAGGKGGDKFGAGGKGGDKFGAGGKRGDKFGASGKGGDRFGAGRKGGDKFGTSGGDKFGASGKGKGNFGKGGKGNDKFGAGGKRKGGNFNAVGGKRKKVK